MEAVCNRVKPAVSGRGFYILFAFELFQVYGYAAGFAVKNFLIFIRSSSLIMNVTSCDPK